MPQIDVDCRLEPELSSSQCGRKQTQVLWGQKKPVAQEKALFLVFTTKRNYLPRDKRKKRKVLVCSPEPLKCPLRDQMQRCFSTGGMITDLGGAMWCRWTGHGRWWVLGLGCRERARTGRAETDRWKTKSVILVERQQEGGRNLQSAHCWWRIWGAGERKGTVVKWWHLTSPYSVLPIPLRVSQVSSHLTLTKQTNKPPVVCEFELRGIQELIPLLSARCCFQENSCREECKCLGGQFGDSSHQGFGIQEEAWRWDVRVIWLFSKEVW